LFLIASLQANAAPLKIMVSTKPLYGLVAKISKDVPELLYDGSTSPHVQNLKPSQVQNLKKATVIFLIGKSYEASLVKTMEKLNLKNGVFLENTPNLKKLPYRFNHHHDDNHEHDDHDDEFDGHLWLDPENARLLLQKIHDTLVDIDPENKAIYHQNLEKAKNEIQLFFDTQKKRMDGGSFKKYVMYHDAFQYFDDFFKTHCVGVVTPPNGHHMTSLKHLQSLKSVIQNENVSVLICEPQFTKEPSLGLKKITIDYLGKEIKSSEHVYEEIIEAIVTQMINAL
jgi:zinc transport system substrate-binding protein